MRFTLSPENDIPHLIEPKELQNNARVFRLVGKKNLARGTVPVPRVNNISKTISWKALGEDANCLKFSSAYSLFRHLDITSGLAVYCRAL